jgi:alkanesulfonate monooxygenase SsuD/methylene tetrahydromethanopterin reductase-like flavin-dependent oxidoreductase (luciferase family)
MLKLTGRLADGWVPSIGLGSPGRLPELHERIDEGALEAGRRPEEIKRLYNVSGRIGPREKVCWKGRSRSGRAALPLRAGERDGHVHLLAL